MAFLSDLDHHRIDATLSDDGTQVLQYESITDVALGLKDHKIQRTWLRKKTLSQGYYSEVWLEEQQDGSKARRAVKTIQKSRMVEIQIDHTRELKALYEFSKAKHRQKGVFVDFLGWWEENDLVSFAMEYFPLGDLEANMKTVLKKSAITQITRQLLQALDIMHGMKFAHRDLKPANIFVVRRDPSWWVKIGDFGMSKQIEGGDGALQTYVGTCNYMAPEFFGYVGNANEEKFEYTCAIDLWALGCIVYRLCTQTVPFPFDYSSVPLKNYCEDPALFPVDALTSRQFSNEFVALVRSLLRSEPSERLPAGAGLALLQDFAGDVLDFQTSDVPLEKSRRSDTNIPNELDPNSISMPPSSSKIVPSKSASQDFSPQLVLSKVELDTGAEKRSSSESSTMGLQYDTPSASRSNSHTLVEGSLAAAQLDSPPSHSLSASTISAKPGFGERAISAPKGTSTGKSLFGRMRRAISGDSASTHSVYSNPFAGAYAPRPPGQLQKLVEANVMGHASGSTQRNRDTKVKPDTPHKYVKSPLASPADTLAPEEEDSVPLTKRDVPKSGTGSAINIRMTELDNLEQTEELLTGVQWDTEALADYCDQLFNPVR
ncbi:hypothetical protein N7G274_002070 [Stereocaulon virgatum]|uniref:non-specific serine/threonine protein kinase n=1 Tax=Stereocaulon virgatum TaxID=373712 RepID=A0ABR4AIP2_9LECA